MPGLIPKVIQKPTFEFTWVYTERDSKIGFLLRHKLRNLKPAPSPMLFNMSCFAAGLSLF
jgi:hypothetical protein